jgi:hypothetical protein
VRTAGLVLQYLHDAARVGIATAERIQHERSYRCAEGDAENQQEQTSHARSGIVAAGRRIAIFGDAARFIPGKMAIQSRRAWSNGS